MRLESADLQAPTHDVHASNVILFPLLRHNATYGDNPHRIVGVAVPGGHLERPLPCPQSDAHPQPRPRALSPADNASGPLVRTLGECAPGLGAMARGLGSSLRQQPEPMATRVLHSSLIHSPMDPVGGSWAVAQAVAGEFLAAYVGHTQAAYRRDLNDFFDYCDHSAVWPLAATRGDVAAYLESLRLRGRSPATLARRMVALRGFYALALAEYPQPGLDHSPVARIRLRRPRTQARIPALSWSQLQAFLATADQATARTRGLAWLLASTGLRISEACTARCEDISLATSAARTERWLEVTCKGSVRRSVPLHAATWSRLEPLLEAGAGPLFATRTGRFLDRHAAARDLIAVAVAAGIPTPFSPHVLRHTFVTLARQSGCALEDVQDAAGHADPATTRAYDRTRQTHAGHPAHRILTALLHTDPANDPAAGPAVDLRCDPATDATPGPTLSGVGAGLAGFWAATGRCDALAKGGA